MAASFRSASNTDWASRTNTTVTAPAGIQNGDLLLFGIATGMQTTDAPDASPPADFVAVPGPTWPFEVTDGGFNMEIRLWRKIASGESGNYTATHSACESVGAMICVSGADATSPLVPNATANSGTGSTSTALGLTTAANGSLVIYWAYDWADTTNALSPPSGSTPTFIERIDTGAAADNVYVATGELATAGATGNKTQTNNSGTHAWMAFLIAVQPPTGGVTSGQAAVSAATTIASTPRRIAQRQAVLSAATAVAATPRLTVQRQAALSAVAAAATTGVANPTPIAAPLAVMLAWAQPTTASTLVARVTWLALEIPGSSGITIVSRQAAISADAAVQATPRRELQRAATILTSGPVEATGTCIRPRAATVSATSAVTAVPQRTLQRAAAISATTAVQTAPSVLVVRAAAINAATSVASVPQRTEQRQVAVSCTSTVTATGTHIASRAAAVSATADVAAIPRRTLQRQAAIAAESTVDATGQVAGIVTRRAAISAATSVVAVPRRTLLRQVAISAATTVEAAPRSELQRQAAVSATTAVTTTGTRIVSRTAAISATTSAATVWQLIRLRQAVVSATATVQTIGQVTGVTSRSADVTATSTVAATPWRLVQRQVIVAATVSVAAATGETFSPPDTVQPTTVTLGRTTTVDILVAELGQTFPSSRLLPGWTYPGELSEDSLARVTTVALLRVTSVEFGAQTTDATISGRTTRVDATVVPVDVTPSTYVRSALLTPRASSAALSDHTRTATVAGRVTLAVITRPTYVTITPHTRHADIDGYDTDGEITGALAEAVLVP